MLLGRPAPAPNLGFGVFGKLPAHGDFYRQNVADPAAQAWINFLSEAIVPVYQARLELPRTPVRFVFRGPAQSSLVGAWIGGVDKVGRNFPLSVYALVATRVLAEAPVVPGAFKAFFDGAAALLPDAPKADGPALAQKVQALPRPEEVSISTAGASLRAAAVQQPASELAQRLFPQPDGGEGGLGYALTTLESATKPFKGREPSRATVTLDCPVQTDADLFLWLELARRALGYSPACFCWTAGPNGRLLLPLGPPAAGLLTHLCEPSPASAALRPLRPADAQAMEGARTNPSAWAKAVQAPGATMQAVLA